MTGMTGLLNAQMNLNLASHVQKAANNTISSGRILEREGIMSKDAETAEKGLALQTEGEEKKNGSLEHLGNALDNIKAAAKEAEEAAKDERKEKAKAEKEAAETRKTSDAAAKPEQDNNVVFDDEYTQSPEIILQIGTHQMTVESNVETAKSSTNDAVSGKNLLV